MRFDVRAQRFQLVLNTNLICNVNKGFRNAVPRFSLIFGTKRKLNSIGFNEL